MIWTAGDEGVIRRTREQMSHCARYHVEPAPWFPLLLRLYEAAQEAGLLETERDGEDPCQTCRNRIGTSCRRAYAGATLDESRRRVLACKHKI